MQLAMLRQCLDCGHGSTAESTGRHLARAGGSAVDQHRAGAALGNAAAIFCPGEPDRVAQHPKQRGVVLDVEIVGLSVNRQRDHRLASAPVASTIFGSTTAHTGTAKAISTADTVSV